MYAELDPYYTCIIGELIMITKYSIHNKIITWTRLIVALCIISVISLTILASILRYWLCTCPIPNGVSSVTC